MTMYGDLALFAGGVSMVTATLGVNDPEVGMKYRLGDEEYIFVYNNGTSQISVGRFAVVTAVTGYSVTVSSITQVDKPIGVCKNATITTGTYGFLLTSGFGPCKAVADSGLAAGDLLCPGVDGAWSNKTVSTGNAGNEYGKVMFATGSAGIGDAFYKIY